jgi:NADH-quinone oxidoreductase subunit M
MPLLNGFIGEFTILLGAWQVSTMWAAFSVLGIVLAAAYLLWLYQRVMFGPVTHAANEKLRDLNLREMVTLVPLVLWCFWIGIYPKPYFEVLERPVAQLVERVKPRAAEQARHGGQARRALPVVVPEPGAVPSAPAAEPR